MQQPKPTNEKYSKIIERIEDGSYQIPKFQRDFVWDKKKTANLIDSLLKGFPFGSFIVWKTKERLKSFKNLGGKFFEKAKDGVDIYYILDGQQRMTSLFLALKGEKTDYFDYKKLYIDLDKDADSDEPICLLEESKTSADLDKDNDGDDPVFSLEENKNLISFYDLMTKDLFDLQDTIGKENARKCKNFKDRIEKYDFSIIEIENLPLGKIVDIFTRINTSGKELTLFEIVNAKIYTEPKGDEKGFDLEEEYNKLMHELERIDYKLSDGGKQLILQLLGLNILKSAKKEAILSISKESFIGEWAQSIKSFRHSIDYARNVLRIPVSKFLPYPALLLPIAYFFRINNFVPPTPQQSKAINKYFFRSAFSWRFSSATETKLGYDVLLINKIKNNQTIDFEKEVWLNETKENFVNYLKNWRFSVGSAFHKAILCIMAYAEPKSFKNNADVRLDNSYLNIATSRNYHHFFPKAYLKRNNLDDKADVIVNITLVDDFLNKRVIRDRAPGDYIKDFSKENPELQETLKTHFIDDLESFGVLNDDYETFLQKRAERIADEILKRI